MENKTAVEWLIENLSYIPFDKTIFQQALEFEKQQIIDAYSADRLPIKDETQEKVILSAAEQYYSETYKKPTE